MTTEQKHTIEIQGLPEGWRAVAYRLGKAGEYFFCATYEEVMMLDADTEFILVLIVEKIKPREITLVETECENAKIAFFDDAGMRTYWRTKEE